MHETNLQNMETKSLSHDENKREIERHTEEDEFETQVEHGKNKTKPMKKQKSKSEKVSNTKVEKSLKKDIICDTKGGNKNREKQNSKQLKGEKESGEEFDIEASSTRVRPKRTSRQQINYAEPPLLKSFEDIENEAKFGTATNKTNIDKPKSSKPQLHETSNSPNGAESRKRQRNAIEDEDEMIGEKENMEDCGVHLTENKKKRKLGKPTITPQVSCTFLKGL